MRLVFDTLIALMLVGILVCVLWGQRNRRSDLREQQLVHSALTRLHDQALLHGAMNEDGVSRVGFPLDIRPEWFDEGVPRNPFAPIDQLWLDVADLGDMADQPADPVITDRQQGSFWYNPNRGIFRARVAPQFSREHTLVLYNRLNGSNLDSLPEYRTPHPKKTRSAASAPDAPAPIASAANERSGPNDEATTAKASIITPIQDAPKPAAANPAPPRRPTLNDRQKKGHEGTEAQRHEGSEG